METLNEGIYEANSPSFTLGLVSASGNISVPAAASATAHIENTTPPPAVSIVGPSGTISAGNGNCASFQVTLSRLSDSPTEVSFQTANGTATAPANYTATSGTVTVPAFSWTDPYPRDH